MRYLNSILRGSSVLAAGLATVAVGIIAISYVAEVVARYGFNAPINWASDIGSYLLCAAAFLMLPMITRHRRHVSVTILLDNLSERRRKLLVRVLEWVTAAVLAIVTGFVIDLCVIQYQQGVLTPMANQIPRWWLTALMAFGLGLATLNYIAPGEASSDEIREI